MKGNRSTDRKRLEELLVHEGRTPFMKGDMCILPILTYGAETWSLTESQKSRLKVCQRSMERSLLSIRLSDRIPTQHHYPVQDPGIVDLGNKSAKLKSNAPGQVGQHHHTLDP